MELHPITFTDADIARFVGNGCTQDQGENRHEANGVNRDIPSQFHHRWTISGCSVARAERAIRGREPAPSQQDRPGRSAGNQSGDKDVLRLSEAVYHWPPQHWICRSCPRQWRSCDSSAWLAL